MKRYTPDRPAIFLHIPKCAGTSFIGLLRRWYGPTYHHPHQDETRDILLPRVRVKLENGNWDPKVKCIHGHFDRGRGYGLPEHYPEIDQYFTIMRDPFDMVVSMYFFVKGRSQRGEYRYRGKVIDIREQYPDLSSYLKVYHAWVEDHLPTDFTVKNSSSYVDSRFVYLGCFEELQRSVDGLADVLGKPRSTLPKQNVSRYDEEIPTDLKSHVHGLYPRAKCLHEMSEKTYRLPGKSRLPSTIQWCWRSLRKAFSSDKTMA